MKPIGHLPLQESRTSHNCAKLTKQRFGRLVAMRPIGRDRWRNRIWLCVCDCKGASGGLGKGIARSTAANLRAGRSQSCGCVQAESNRRRHLQETG